MQSILRDLSIQKRSKTLLFTLHYPSHWSLKAWRKNASISKRAIGYIAIKLDRERTIVNWCWNLTPYEFNHSINIENTILEKTIELKSNLTPAYYNLALLQEAKNQNTEALNSMRLAAGYSSTDNLDQDLKILIFSELSRLLLAQNQVNEAIAYLQELISIQPNNWQNLWLMSNAYEQKGEKQKALNELNKIIQAYPDNEQVREKIETLSQNE